MSGVRHFHKKEAARILIELRNKTEDERLMDYRRQLLQSDGGDDETQSFNDFQERLEQSLWPWAYPNPSLAQYNPNISMPFGYPCVSSTPFWFPPGTCLEPSPATYNLPSFQGVHDFQHTLPWPQLAATHPQGFIDPGQVSRRRRTKFTNEQLAVLEKTFTHGSKFPSPGERMRLEARTGLSKEKISVWFQNRRAKEKREKCQEGNNKEKEESTSDESELENETEDEVQLRVCDDTPEEESENEKVQHQSIGKYYDAESRSVSAQVSPYNEAQVPNSLYDETQVSACDETQVSAYDETQVSAFDETNDIVGAKRSHASQDLSPSYFESPKEKKTDLLCLEKKPKRSDVIETKSEDDVSEISSMCDVSNSDVIKTLVNAVEVTDADPNHDESKKDDSRFQNKRRKLFPTGQDMSNSGINSESYTCLEYRLFGET